MQSSSSLKCFSIMTAPRAVAAMAVSMPGVWSDRPTRLKPQAVYRAIAPRLASSILEGYCAMQCNATVRNGSLAGISDAQSAIPPDIITGKPVANAACVRSESYNSALAILIAGAPMSFRNLTPSTEKALLNMVMPIEAA